MNGTRLAVGLFSSLVTLSALANPIALDCPAGTVQVGTPKVETFCITQGTREGAAQGLRNGPYVDFWKNGQVQSRGQYVNGQRSGLWVYFDEAGRKKGETEFLAGDYHGRRVEYFANGSKKLEQTWVKGHREGEAREFNQDGSLRARRTYRADRVVAER